MKVIAVALACAMVATVVDVWQYYPAVFGLRPLVDIVATWTTAIAFSIYWRTRYAL